MKDAMSGQTSKENQDMNSPQTGTQSKDDFTSIDTVEVSSGKVLVGDNETTYVGATHWAAILEDVSYS